MSTNGWLASSCAAWTTPGPLLVALWIAAFTAAACWVLATARDLESLSRGFAAGGVTLLLAACLPLASHALARQAVIIHPGQALATGVAPGSRSHRPTIYHIVLDGYARQDVLQDVFFFDNRPFLTELERRGFQVVREAWANYAQTALSLAALFGMDYLDDVARQLAPGEDSRAVLRPLINQSPFLRTLRSQGYTLVAFESGYWPAQLLEVDHLESALEDPQEAALPLRRSYEFYSALCDLTPLGSRLLPDYTVARAARRNEQLDRRQIRIYFALESLPLPDRYRRPLYVYAHVLCPHPPFTLLEPKGSPFLAPPWDVGDGDHMVKHGSRRGYYRRMYPRQVARLNELVLAAVDRITHDPEAIVLIHADHGSGINLRWEQPERSDMRERLGILLAARLPRQGRLPADITPVNYFRFLLNRLFDARLPMLPNESYFSTWTHPYRFMRATDKWRLARPTPQHAPAKPAI